LAKKYERFHPELFDGVRIPMGKVWVLARKPNSESAIRIYAESAVSKADAAGVAETIRKELEEFAG
jgi:phosphomannomutase